MKLPPEKYCRLLSENTKAVYRTFGEVFCPAIGKTVTFNADGFHHLLFKPNRFPRSIKERIHKLTLVPLAIPVIKGASSVYTKRIVWIKKIAKEDKKVVEKQKSTQYAIVARVGKKHPIDVRVIILKVGNGKPIFWSIMRH